GRQRPERALEIHDEGLLIGRHRRRDVGSDGERHLLDRAGAQRAEGGDQAPEGEDTERGEDETGSGRALGSGHPDLLRGGSAGSSLLGEGGAGNRGRHCFVSAAAGPRKGSAKDQGLAKARSPALVISPATAEASSPMKASTPLGSTVR